jgi:Zn-dependent M28 family amino/carboxypeptidase
MVSRAAACALAVAAVAMAAPPAASAPAFSGASALEFTRRAVAFGPRPSGSDAIRKLQAYIYAQLKPLGCGVSSDDFRGSTPLGQVPMKNIIARFPGTSRRVVAITGHYDTKVMPGRYFVGANDGGSSTGFLLELARVLAKTKHKDDIWLVWFDGEEAVAQWSETDGTYGSRHLAARWASDGTLARLKAVLNVDMIGDRDLGLVNDAASSQALRRLVWDAAARLGLGRYFLSEQNSMLDDHSPFLDRGAKAVDLIDFSYGPHNAYWHTDQDTMDKLSAGSFTVVGKVVLEAIRALE